MYKFIVISMLAGILMMTTVNSACAGPYIDFGTTYVRTVEVHESLSVDLGHGYTIQAEREARLNVDQWGLMLRAGYKFENGLHLEYDTIGTLDERISRVNFYHRWEFDVHK